MSMNDRTIIQGETISWVGSFEDADGAVIDFSSANRTAQLRMYHLLTGATTTKITSTSADWTWTSQSTGVGYWTFTSTETAALAKGEYRVDVVYTDTTSTPDTVHIVGGPVFFSVRAAKVGAL